VPAPPASAPTPQQAARLAASWNGTVYIWLIPYTVALQPWPAALSSSASALAQPPPQTPTVRAPGVHIRPECTCKIDLAAGEVAAKIGWVATGGSDAAGGHKLVVIAVPALAGAAAGTGSRAGEILFPTIYVYNADTGARDELLELGSILSEASRMTRWLAGMNAATAERFNALGERVAAEIGEARGARAGAPWAQVQYLPAADQLCVDRFHMMCNLKLVGVLPKGGGGDVLCLYQAQHMSWQRQVRHILRMCISALRGVGALVQSP
jgi:hypothetical protein